MNSTAMQKDATIGDLPMHAIFGPTLAPWTIRVKSGERHPHGGGRYLFLPSPVNSDWIENLVLCISDASWPQVT